MKQLINHPIFKIVSLTVLYLFASICLYQSIFLAAPYLSFRIQGFFSFLPTIVSLVIPMISLIYAFIYCHSLNVKRRWHILHSYSRVICIISSLCLVGQILVITLSDFTFSNVVSGFPYTAIAIDAIYLASCIIVAFYIGQNNYLRKVKITLKSRPNLMGIISSIFMIIVSGYYLGDALSFVSLIEEGFDNNFFLTIPILVTFLYGTIQMVLYVKYKTITDSDKRFIYYRYALFYSFIAMLLLDTVEIAMIMINPQIFVESMDNFLPFQRYLNFPLAIIIATGFPLALTIVACVRFGRLKNEQKSKETSDQK